MACHTHQKLRYSALHKFEPAPYDDAVEVVVPEQLAGLGTFTAEGRAAGDGPVVSIQSAEIARLVRSGWRCHDLRAGDRVLATFRRVGVWRARYRVEVGGVELSAGVEWAPFDPLDTALAELVAATTHPGARTVRLRPIDDGRSQTWTISPPPLTGPLRFTSHLPWPGRPRITVRARHARAGHDVLVVVIGVCAVLARRSLTFDIPARQTRRR